MASLNEIKGIGEASLQLLAAAGIQHAESLAAQDAGDLVEELRRTNESLGISKRPPGIATVEKWIAGAADLVGAPPPAAVDEPGGETSASPVPVNYEANGEVAEMLSRSPYAIPLAGRIMMEKGLAVSDIPAGLLLNRYSGDLDVRVDDPAAQRTEVPSRRSSGNMETIEKTTARRHFEASSAKPMGLPTTGEKRIPKSKQGHEEDRVSLIRAPREQTNRGKDPESRSYVRGVLHTHPWSLRTGAFFSLLLLVNLPLAVIAALLLLLSREMPETFPAIPEWFLAFPIALPITGLGYLFWGVSGKCRICTQKLFVHKAALKHVKAHHFKGIGYVVPLCIHLLLFSWFRCSSCGTPVRLKK
ncbi:DUF4332 domain-containing protein [Akkermansiaceae bacterium]|nr:DUF4332 domain-containing protein [Akkermansiaceae bacterium]